MARTYKFKDITIHIKTHLSRLNKNMYPYFKTLKTTVRSRNDGVGLIREEIKRVENSCKDIHEIILILYPFNYKHRFEIETKPNEPIQLRNLVPEWRKKILQQYRKHNKVVPIKTTFVPGLTSVEMTGRVFSKPNQVYELYVQKKVKEIYNPKIPVNNIKYIGVELEFCAPVNKTELSLKLYHAGVHKFGQLKEDHSLRPKENETAFELALLFHERNFKTDLKKVIKVLNDCGAVVENRRCGLHVHLDMRSRSKSLVYSNLVATQSALLTVVDPKRINNEFCRLVTSRKFPTTFTGERQERYKTINAAAFFRYKTLEVRMYQGCVNYQEIVNWMSLLITIANYKKVIRFDIKDLTNLKKRVKLEKKTYEYLIDRSCYWQLNGRTSEPIEEYATATFISPSEILRRST